MGEAPRRPGTDATAREVWQYACEVLGRGDCDGWADVLAKDAVVEWPFAPDGIRRRFVGREEVRRHLTPVQRAARDVVVGRERLSVTVHETSDPEVLVAELDGIIEVAGGVRFRMPLVHVVRVRGGEIIEFKDYFNASMAASAYAEVLEPLRDAG